MRCQRIDTDGNVDAAQKHYDKALDTYDHALDLIDWDEIAEGQRITRVLKNVVPGEAIRAPIQNQAGPTWMSHPVPRTQMPGGSSVKYPIRKEARR